MEPTNAELRRGGIALIAGTIGTIVTMLFHPHGHDLVNADRFAVMSIVNTAVHSLALLCLPILFFGALVLTRRTKGADSYADSALVFYGFAAFAVMIAAAASGLIAPGLGKLIIDADAAKNTAVSQMWRIAFNYNGFVNQAFAKIFVVGSSIAIALWSLTMRRQRVVNPDAGIYGLIIAPLAVVGVAGGVLRLNVHGFGLVVLAQAAWYVGVGVSMIREARAATQA